MNKFVKVLLVFVVLLIACGAFYLAYQVYRVPFEYMQTIATYDSEANTKTWDVLKHFIKEGDALIIIQPDGNYTLQVYRGQGIYDFRCIPEALLQQEFLDMTKNYERVWVFLYNGVLQSGSISIPEAYRSVLKEQYLACFKLPLFFGDRAYLDKTEQSELGKAVFAQNLLEYISDIATAVDYRDLSVVFQKAGQLESAKEVLLQAVKAFPNNAMLFRRLAECYKDADDLAAYDKIFSYNVRANIFSRAKDKMPMLDALFQNAIFTSRMKEYDRAKTLYLALVKLFSQYENKKLESQVRRYFVKDVLLPMGDTNEAISQLLVDIYLGSQAPDYSYNYLLDIVDNCGYSNAAVSAGYGFFKVSSNQSIEPALRYAKMALKYGTEEQLVQAINNVADRSRYNPNLQKEMRKQKDLYNAWTNAAISRKLVPFGEKN